HKFPSVGNQPRAKQTGPQAIHLRPRSAFRDWPPPRTLRTPPTSGMLVPRKEGTKADKGCDGTRDAAADPAVVARRGDVLFSGTAERRPDGDDLLYRHPAGVRGDRRG